MQRIVFQFDGNKHHKRKWWIFRGEKIEFNPSTAYRITTVSVKHGELLKKHEVSREGVTVCGVYVDGKKVAKGTNEQGGWLVNNRWIADRMYVDSLPYTLEGRALPENWCDDTDSSPCIFCGKRVMHINGGGIAWAGSTKVGKEVVHFLYCNAVCTPLAGEPIWTCVHCSIDLVGSHCHECGKGREEADRNLDKFEAYR